MNCINEDPRTATSETAKYRGLTTPYCIGCGIDIGSGGNPVVPHAMSMDLPPKEFAHYRSNLPPEHAVHLPGDATNLHWFKDGVLDFVYSSHLLEDFLEWTPILWEWARVLKRGGHMIILVPDKKLWNEAIARGQPPNCAHRHESYLGELTEHFNTMGGFTVLSERMTNLYPGDYTILFIEKKL